MTPLARSLTSAAFGAAAMYLFDPRGGRRRRALIRDRMGSTTADLSDTVGVAARDLRYRARGLGAWFRSLFTTDEVPDEVLTERVRAALGRAVSHPGAIEVSAKQGRVTLSGAVLAEEYSELLDVACSVRGVEEVADQLGVYESAEGVPQLQGGRQRRRPGFPLLRQNWSPAARVLVGAAGGAIAGWGARQLLGTRGNAVLAGSAAAAGAVLLLRSATNVPVTQLAGAGGRRAVDIRKTVHIEAPIERVFETLANFENFPSFMHNVRSVHKHPDGRSHWVVAGPAGVSVDWDSEITVLRKNEVLGWRSLSNATVAHAGLIRFERDGTGTRLDIRMTYNPPGGVFGHGIAKIFGADPKLQLDQDFQRLKTFLETGVTARDVAQPRAGGDGAASRP